MKKIFLGFLFLFIFNNNFAEQLSVAFNDQADPNFYQCDIKFSPLKEANNTIWAKIKSIFTDAFVEAYKHLTTKQLNTTSPTIRDYLLNSFEEKKKLDITDYFLISALNNQQSLLGYALITFKNENMIYISLLAVDPKLHKRGIGKKLINFIKNLNPSVKKISLVTRKLNFSARGFYKHLNFKELDNYMPEFLAPFYKKEDYIYLELAI